MSGISLAGFEPVFVILVVALINAMWAIPASIQPLTLVRFLAQRMGDKVLPKASLPPLQHYISSTLGFVVLVVPIGVILTILIAAAQFPWFFDGLLLLFALNYNDVVKTYQRVQLAIGKQKKILARQTLKQVVIRETDSLSEVGVAKAAIESLLLRYYKQYCAVLFWYVLAGPIVALGYRCLLEFAWTWNSRQQGYRYFGIPLKKMTNLMALIPTYLAATLMLIVTSPTGALSAWRRCPHRDTSSRLLALFGGGLDIQLGGPAIYAGHKIRYSRVGGKRLVKYSDMTFAYNAIQRNTILWLVLLVLLGLITAAIK